MEIEQEYTYCLCETQSFIQLSMRTDVHTNTTLRSKSHISYVTNRIEA